MPPKSVDGVVVVDSVVPDPGIHSVGKSVVVPSQGVEVPGPGIHSVRKSVVVPSQAVDVDVTVSWPGIQSDGKSVVVPASGDVVVVELSPSGMHCE